MAAPERAHTPWGDVSYSRDSVTVAATHQQLYAWAHRPGSTWPLSYLADLDDLFCTFDAGGLLALDASPSEDRDIPADEFNAWSSDVLRDALPADHPAYFVAVGQFQGGDA